MDSGFPTTKYSLMAQLRSPDSIEQKSALGLFIEGYRRALLKFLVVNKRVNQHDAEDIVHDFIVEKVMSGRVLEATENKGKFRSLLCKSLQNFLIDSLRKRKTNQKNFESNSGLFALENIREEFDVFDGLWAKGVLTAVLKQMEVKSPYWRVFKERILTIPPKSYSDLVETCGFENPVQASNALMTAKRTFMRLIAETISDSPEFSKDDDLNEEIRLLKRVLLDSREISDLVESLDSIDLPQSDGLRLPEDDSVNTISRELGAAVDAEWTSNEVEVMSGHLMASRVGDFLSQETSPVVNQSIEELLLENKFEAARLLDVTRRLKQYFKYSSEDGEVKLPRQVLVTIVFALIARYIDLGGEISEITSIELEALKPKLRLILEKPWISEKLARLFESVCSSAS